MKGIALSLLCLVAAGAVHAQQADTARGWSRTGMAGATLSQVALSNWSAGGDNSVAFDLNFACGLDYKQGRRLWNNRLELAYGMSNTSSAGARKTDDKIYLSSTYGYRIAPKWYASGFVTFNSQFANGFDYATDPATLISQFMAPGYLTAGPGFTWTPAAWFKATLSPAAWRGTFVLDDALSDAGAYGVDPGRTLLSEFGASATLEATKEFLLNMTVYSRLVLYSNYLRKPGNVDVNWDTQLVMKINKWFSANLSVSMIYDDDTKLPRSDGTPGPALQVKEVLGVGLQVVF